jgi:hypothetical protein
MTRLQHRYTKDRIFIPVTSGLTIVAGLLHLIGESHESQSVFGRIAATAA